MAACVCAACGCMCLCCMWLHVSVLSVVTSCSGCLQSGQRRLWSRLRSMQFLQKVWPQGVVTGSKNSLRRGGMWSTVEVVIIVWVVVVDIKQREEMQSDQWLCRRLDLINPGHWPDAEGALKIGHRENTQSFLSALNTSTWNTQRQKHSHTQALWWASSAGEEEDNETMIIMEWLLNNLLGELVELFIVPMTKALFRPGTNIHPKRSNHKRAASFCSHRVLKCLLWTLVIRSHFPALFTNTHIHVFCSLVFFSEITDV